jgi:transcriptional regulator with XRE-family HTH domain
MTLRKYRLDRGLSQEQLAAMAGLSPRTVQRIERGAVPSLETLKCLAAALDVGLDDLRGAITSPEARDEAERIAQAQVRDLRDFHVHALQYAVVIAGLLVLNLMTSPGTLWSAYAAAAWGLGLMVHGLSVFGVFGPFGEDWERRQVARRLQR